LPSWIRSRKATLRPIYFLAMETTSRVLALMRCFARQFAVFDVPLELRPAAEGPGSIQFLEPLLGVLAALEALG